MTFAFLLNLAIGLGYLALRRGRSRLWPWAYGALGLAVLSKGPVAMLLAGAMGALDIIQFSPTPTLPPQGGGVKSKS